MFGCVELLQARGSTVLKDPLGCALFALVHFIQMQTSIILVRSAPSVFKLWCNVLPPVYHQILRTPLVYKAAELCLKTREVSSAARCTENHKLKPNCLLTKLMDCDAELDAFREKYITPLSTITAREASLRDKCPEWFNVLMLENGAPAHSLSFETLLDAFGWSLISAARIQIHQSILAHLDNVSTEQALLSRSTILKQVDDIHVGILANLFLTEDNVFGISTFQVMCAVNPCSLVLSVTGIVARQSSQHIQMIAWIRRLLVHCSQRFGVGTAARMVREFDAAWARKAHRASDVHIKLT